MRNSQPTQSGFTLVELMISIGIIGILASLAIPTFANFRHRVHLSEAYTQLGNLFRGEAAYYTTPVTMKFDGFWGIADPPERTECRVSCYGPISSDPLNEGWVTVPEPSSPIVGPFAGVCQAVGFALDSPTRLAYLSFISNGAGQFVETSNGICPNPNVAPQAIDTRVYENRAFYRIGSLIGQYSEYIHVNENRELYRAGREFKPDVNPALCALGTSHSPAARYALALVATVLTCRRRRRQRIAVKQG